MADLSVRIAGWNSLTLLSLQAAPTATASAIPTFILCQDLAVYPVRA